MGRVLIWTFLLLWAVSLFVGADDLANLATKTGLDRDLVGLVEVNVGGAKLTVTFVFINERTFQSRISSELAWLLQPYLGQNAVYVNPNVDAVVGWFDFDPQLVSVRQDSVETWPSLQSWTEITPGFLDGTFEVNPSGPEQGSGSEGILILGDTIDPQLPFELTYAGSSAAFAIADTSAVGSQNPGAFAAAVQSHDPIEVDPLETLGTLEDLLLHEAFSAEAVAAAFGLDANLVRTMVLSPRGNELRLLFIRLEASVRTSSLGSDLIDALDEVIGTGAVMVWVVSSNGADFSPWNFYVRQHDTNFVFFSAASFVELTEDFLRVERVHAREVVAGVIRLPRSVDAAAPFSVFYGTSSVDYP